jgi:hypothetical protein
MMQERYLPATMDLPTRFTGIISAVGPGYLRMQDFFGESNDATLLFSSGSPLEELAAHPELLGSSAVYQARSATEYRFTVLGKTYEIGSTDDVASGAALRGVERAMGRLRDDDALAVLGAFARGRALPRHRIDT